MSFIPHFSQGAIFERAHQLARERPEVMTLYHIMGHEKFIEWALSVGVLHDERIRAATPPLPPFHLRSIAGGASEALYLWTGLKDADSFATLFAEHGPKKPIARVLDFGTGTARIARYMQTLPQFEMYACDAQPELAKWCADNFPKIKIIQSQLQPPLPYPDSFFDLVYAKSVFTHFSETTGQVWLRDLIRIIEPGGILIVTTNSDAALNSILGVPQNQQAWGITQAEAEDIKSVLSETGFYYRPFSSGQLARASVGNDYGHTFILEKYIRLEWPKLGLEIAGFIPEQSALQDIVALRKL